MAERLGGGAAFDSFHELLTTAGAVVQRVRARLSPPDAQRTWLGLSPQLAESIAGSVLQCESLDTGPFVMVIPPRVTAVATVRRIRGVVSVRVSRDGSLAASRYEDISVFGEMVRAIVPGILTMGGARGALADTVRLLASGEPVTVVVTASPQQEGPLFTVRRGDEVVVDSSADWAAVLSELSVCAVPWAQFASGSWWGLPPVEVPLVRQPMAWAADADALGISAVFGLPPVSSNVDALLFLVGCCEPPQGFVSTEELSQCFTDEAPAEERAAVVALLSMLSAATPSQPEVVDSVHSRLKAIMQSADAPATFVAFGRAWRQGALEPPSRLASRSASPSSARAHRRLPSSPARPPAATWEDEIDAMSPDTMRRKLRAVLTTNAPPGATPQSQPAGAAATSVAAPVLQQRTTSTAGRLQSTRVQHSGQLGGLFGRGLAASDPSLTSAGARAPTPGPSPRPPGSGASPGPRLIPAPTTGAAPSIASVLRTVAPEETEAVATAVVIPESFYHLPVTAVVEGLVAHGMPDVVAQLAHAAGDTAIRATPGSTFEAVCLLRHIEEVFADVSSAATSFQFLDRPVAHDWPSAVEAVQALLSKHSSTFRNKRQRAAPASAEATTSVVAVDDKPPVGSFKQVPTATAAERPGACDAQLLEDMASAGALRREHVRQSPFYTSNTSTAERDAALPGELAHFCTTYGQAATAYIFSNGAAQTALSGYGVPMALAAIRLHLLARATNVVHSALGFERALSMHAKCASLAMGFLTGIIGVEDCVTLLGGSAPHEDAEIRREGGALSSGMMGSTSGENAQLSIREAFAMWGQGLHRVMGEVPGITTSGTDFDVCAQLKRIPRETFVEKLLSVCRYMTSRIGLALSRHRTIRGEPLPDVRAIVVKAVTLVFQERDLDQRTEERATAAMGPLVARIQLLEEAQAKAAKGSVSGAAKAASSGRASFRAKNASVDTSQAVTPAAEPTLSATSAQEAAHKFLASLNAGSPGSPAAAPSTSGSSAAGNAPSPGTGRLGSRPKAMAELSAIYRRHVGMDPKGDPTQEPCAYRALFGKCGAPDCVRCATNKSFPSHILEAVRARCDPKIFNVGSPSSSGRAKGQGKDAKHAESK